MFCIILLHIIICINIICTYVNMPRLLVLEKHATWGEASPLHLWLRLCYAGSDTNMAKKFRCVNCSSKQFPLTSSVNFVVVGSSTDLSPLSAKISLWKGDITTLEIDAIMNAANPSLTGAIGRSYVTVAVHHAAGESLMYECARLGECDEGDTKLTHGHRLPAKCE